MSFIVFPDDFGFLLHLVPWQILVVLEVFGEFDESLTILEHGFVVLEILLFHH